MFRFARDGARNAPFIGDMRIAIAVTMLLVASKLAFPAVNQEHPYHSKYVKDMYGPRAWPSSGAGATILHLRNVPREWGRGKAGFGKRLGSALGQHVVKNTIEFAVASARHEELG
jgi:hypothetical protein